MTDKQKRKQYSLEHKLRILKEIESGRKQADVGREFKLSSSTLSMILKNKDKIKNLTLQSNSLCTRKRMRLGNYSEIETALIVWLKDLQDKNDLTATGPVIQAKAVEFAKQLGITGFEASNGWLFRFRVRNGLQLKPNSSEQDVDIKSISQLSTNEIFNFSPPKTDDENKINNKINSKKKYPNEYSISSAEAYIYIGKIKQFLQQQQDVPLSVDISVDEIEDYISLQLY